MTSNNTNVYLATLARMEPDIAMVDRDAALASIAISLKRIADIMAEPDTHGETGMKALTRAIWAGIIDAKEPL